MHVPLEMWAASKWKCQTGKTYYLKTEKCLTKVKKTSRKVKGENIWGSVYITFSFSEICHLGIVF